MQDLLYLLLKITAGDLQYEPVRILSEFIDRYLPELRRESLYHRSRL